MCVSHGIDNGICVVEMHVESVAFVVLGFEAPVDVVTISLLGCSDGHYQVQSAVFTQLVFQNFELLAKLTRLRAQLEEGVIGLGFGYVILRNVVTILIS